MKASSIQGEEPKVVIEDKECAGFLCQFEICLVGTWRARFSLEWDLMRVGNGVKGPLGLAKLREEKVF